MKVFYIATSALSIFWIRHYLYDTTTSGTATHHRYTTTTHRPYDPEMDTMSHWVYVAFPCSLMAFLTHFFGRSYQNEPFSIILFLWTFSIYLEALAMLPQLILIWRYRRVERWAAFYIFAMGLYRAFYILNWIYRANYERGYRHHWVVYCCGVLQTLLYTDFFYYACTKRDRPLLAWRRTLADSTTATDHVEATDPLLTAEEQMRVV
jgi:ER lumen protein retaining receptor